VAEALAKMDGVAIDLDAVETNIAIFKLTGGRSAHELTGRLKARGILMTAIGPETVRLVTHLDVSRGDCVTAAEALAEEMERSGS
jgi:threonine aldolase